MGPFAPRLRAALLAGRRIGVRGAGAPSLRRGDGYEFSELRGYVDGDDPRRIDWAATARAGRTSDARRVGRPRDGARRRARCGRPRCASVASARTTTWRAMRPHAGSRRRATTIVARASARGRLFLRDVRGRAGARGVRRAARRTGPARRDLAGGARACLPRGARLLVASDFFELDATLAAVRANASRAST